MNCLNKESTDVKEVINYEILICYCFNVERLVNIDSGSYDKAGVNQVGDLLAGRLAALDFDVQRSMQKEFGNHVNMLFSAKASASLF